MTRTARRRRDTPLTAPLLASLMVHGAVVMTLVVPFEAVEKDAVLEPIPTAAPLHGTTFETDTAGETPAPPVEQEAPTPPSMNPSDGPALAPSAKPRARSSRRTSKSASAARAAESSESGGRYGAVGDRAAVDLATAFTRGFPSVASADPSWQAAPIGTAGEIVLTLSVSPEGALVSSSVSGRSTPPLARGIERTMALLRGRTFVARGAVTRLAVRVTVRSDDVHDGLHGEVFALGATFAGGRGEGFFALAVGRRIDLHVREY